MTHTQDLTIAPLEGSIDDTRLRNFADLKRLDYDELKKAVDLKLAGAGLDDTSISEEEYRYSEYLALMNSSCDSQDALVLRPQAIQEYDAAIQDYFESIVLVEKLAETRALTGFARIIPPPYREFDRGDRKQLSLQPRPWLPAVRVYGEGVFFILRREALSRWSQEAVLERCPIIGEGH